MKAKSNLLVIVLTLFTCSIIAQNIEVTHQANGTVLSVPVQSIDSVIFQLVPPPSMKNIYQSNGNVLSIAMDDVDSITYVIPNPSLLPQVSTGSPTVLSSSSVYVDGNVTADGGSPVSQRGFCWSLSPNPTIANNTSQNGTGLGSFNQTVQPLSPSTTYYIRAYATNTEGTAYGNQVTVTTSAPNTNGSLPIVETLPIQYYDGYSAISGGNVIDDGGLAVTSRGVCWAIGTTPTINNVCSNDGMGAGSFQSSVSNLILPSISYFVRAYATNEFGTAYGVTYAFSTTSFGTYPSGTIHCSGPTWLVEVINPVTGKIWMDRNLGANQVATSATDGNSYGDLYQWGRKADGHQCRNSNATATISSTIEPNHPDFIWAISDEGAWHTIHELNLWQGNTGINNPCPIGFRIPSITELSNERNSWNPISSSGAFSSPLKWTRAGNRIHNGVQNASIYGFYWSSNTSFNSATGWYLGSDLVIYSSTAQIEADSRRTGQSVRCIKD